MNQPGKLTADPKQTGDDCPLSVARQHWNIGCFAVYWGTYYLAAPVSYIGLTHANLLKGLGNNDTVSNLPLAMYLWLAVVPVLMAWFFSQPRYLKPLAAAVDRHDGREYRGRGAGVMERGAVLGRNVDGRGTRRSVRRRQRRRHYGSVGLAAQGRLHLARGKTLGFAFGAGPLFACVGWCRMRCWTADCWGDARSVWRFPTTTWPCSPPLPRCFSCRPPAWPPSACPARTGRRPANTAQGDRRRAPAVRPEPGGPVHRGDLHPRLLRRQCDLRQRFLARPRRPRRAGRHARPAELSAIRLQGGSGRSLGMAVGGRQSPGTLFATTSILLTGIGWA